MMCVQDLEMVKVLLSFGADPIRPVRIAGLRKICEHTDFPVVHPWHVYGFEDASTATHKEAFASFLELSGQAMVIHH